MLKIALSHDVDRIKKTYQYLTRSLKAISEFNIKGILTELNTIFTPNMYWGFDKIIKIENEFDVKSTFFFLNETIPFNLFSPSNWKLSLGRYNISNPKIIDIIKYLDGNGWEIGLHGSYSSHKDKKLLAWEKSKLESITGHEILGIRQHYLNLSQNTWKYQNEIGLKYDSSWGLNNDIGFKENKIKPFRPFDNNFLVIPMSVMDIAFVDTNNKWEKLKKIIEKTVMENSILVINWHTNYFNEKEFPNYETDYIKIIEECKKYNSKFYTLRDYYLECSSISQLNKCL
jgi:peptidoglycan/xylan/chitin deacetylase (PgdA/CDA1 family)